MEIEHAIEHIVKVLGPNILCNKNAMCNCLEDVLPEFSEHYNMIRMIYDDKIGKILLSALQKQEENLDSYKNEITSILLKRGMSIEYSSTFLSYFNWIFQKRIQTITKNVNVHNQQISVAHKDSALKGAKIGYCVEFGKYPYWQQGREEPLVWRVLDIKGDNALLISNKVVEYKPLVDDDKCFLWQDSFLAKWLNSVFYVKAFNNMEMAQLVFNKNVNQFITIPSMDELKKYYCNNSKSEGVNYIYEKARTLQTPYVADKNKESDNRYSGWWLRDFSPTNGRVNYVSQEGEIVEADHKEEALNPKGVRPLIWIKSYV